MDKTTLNIKLAYRDMGKAEKRIADWIFAHPGEILPLSIVDLAEKCGCSEATIVRFAKRLKLSGYQELKISLAQESGAPAAGAHILPEDDAEAIFGKVCDDVYCALEMTKKVLDKNALESACKAVCAARRIIVIGLGNSASVALDAAHKFLRAGLDAVAYSDNHMQVIAASHLTKEDAVFAISHSGSSKDIVETLAIAKAAGAVTIAVTNVGRSPIQKYADHVLYTSADETRYNILALSSRIAQLAVIGAVYGYLVYHKSPDTPERIRETERALLTKKY